MPGIFLICHNIRSLHNVGAIFRSAEVLGVSRLYLTGYTATPLDKLGKVRREVAKTALGAEETVSWKRVSQIGPLLATIRRQGIQVVALENVKDAVPLHRFRPRYPVALVLGNEVRGLSRAVLSRADAVVRIPSYGRNESLNVAVACGVALYALRARRGFQ